MAVKGKSKGDILAAFEARLKHEPAAETRNRARRDRPHRRAAHRRDHGVSARVIRGRVLSFRDDPRLAGASALAADRRRRGADRQRPHRGGRRSGRDPGERAAPARRSTIIAASWCCRASSTRISIIRRRASSAPMARNCSTGCNKYTFVEEQKFADLDHCADGRALLSRRIVPPGHDHRLRLLHSAPAIGRGLLRRSRAARRAHDRRQGDDGPQCAAGADRHRRARL